MRKPGFFEFIDNADRHRIFRSHDRQIDFVFLRELRSVPRSRLGAIATGFAS